MNCSFCAAAAPENPAAAARTLKTMVVRFISSILLRKSLFFCTIPGRNAFFLGVLGRRRLDHGAHDRLVGRDPVADDLPLLTVPLLELDRAAALVVEARELEGLHEADRAELLQALLVNVQVLQGPAHLLAGDRFALAEALLRLAHRLGGDDGPLHA